MINRRTRSFRRCIKRVYSDRRAFNKPRADGLREIAARSRWSPVPRPADNSGPPNQTRRNAAAGRRASRETNDIVQAPDRASREDEAPRPARPPWRPRPPDSATRRAKAEAVRADRKSEECGANPYLRHAMP